MKKPGSFIQGLLWGTSATFLVALCIVYVLNMKGLVVVYLPFVPGIQQFLKWAFDNLRLSMVPFALILLLYARDLAGLKKMLGRGGVPLVQVSQKEHLVDIWISLFFGVGVIWTAIGMRSALMSGLGGLSNAAGSNIGALGILDRLVNGGILLALSTTIFGGVGGYLMRVFKALAIGYDLRQYYTDAADRESGSVLDVLNRIENRLTDLRRP